MELEGHPTQDLIEELARRGAEVSPIANTEAGTAFASEMTKKRPDDRGLWLFIPAEAFETGLDDEIS
jgi:hypothetical protein